MNVPYISSGALSRFHYGLVRKVEATSSPELADEHLLEAINFIRRQLSNPSLSLVCDYTDLSFVFGLMPLQETMQGTSNCPAILSHYY